MSTHPEVDPPGAHVRRRRFDWRAGALAAVACLALGGAAALLTTRWAIPSTPSPSPTASAVLPQPGDCWANSPDVLTQATGASCAQEHLAQVVSVGTDDCDQSIPDLFPNGIPAGVASRSYTSDTGGADVVCTVVATDPVRPLTQSVLGGELTWLAVPYDIGECLAEPPTDPSIRTEPIDCGEPHTLEWLGSIEVAEPTRGNPAQLTDAADGACWDLVGTTLGASEALTRVREMSYRTSDDEWVAGNRRVVCAIAALPGTTLTGSALGGTLGADSR